MGPTPTSKTLPRQNPGTMEAPQNTNVGTGIRPTPSRFKIEDSMTGCDPKTLGRDPGGSLK